MFFQNWFLFFRIGFGYHFELEIIRELTLSYDNLQ